MTHRRPGANHRQRVKRAFSSLQSLRTFAHFVVRTMLDQAPWRRTWGFILENDLSTVRFVTNRLVKRPTWQPIWECTVVRSHLHVLYVTKHSRRVAVWPPTCEHTRVTGHTSARSVVKALVTLPLLQSTCVFTPVRSRTGARSVRWALASLEIWIDIWKFTSTIESTTPRHHHLNRHPSNLSDLVRIDFMDEVVKNITLSYLWYVNHTLLSKPHYLS